MPRAKKEWAVGHPPNGETHWPKEYVRNLPGRSSPRSLYFIPMDEMNSSTFFMAFLSHAKIRGFSSPPHVVEIRNLHELGIKTSLPEGPVIPSEDVLGALRLEKETRRTVC